MDLHSDGQSWDLVDVVVEMSCLAYHDLDPLVAWEQEKTESCLVICRSRGNFGSSADHRGDYHGRAYPKTLYVQYSHVPLYDDQDQAGVGERLMTYQLLCGVIVVAIQGESLCHDGRLCVDVKNRVEKSPVRQKLMQLSLDAEAPVCRH